MPTKELQTNTVYFGIENPNGDFTKLGPLGNSVEVEQIEVSDLEKYKSNTFNRNGELEISFDMDKQVAQKIYAELQPKHGEKLTVETSCVCDGTLLFAVQLMQSLAKIGATNIKIRSEEVENPEPAWMKTRFIATGTIWNTNNFRRLHGIPMKRRRK